MDNGGKKLLDWATFLVNTLCCRVGEYIIVLYCEATNIQLRVHGVVLTLINICALLLPLVFTWAVFT